MPGLYFEEFEVGAVIEHGTRRTVTETDNVLFSTMTLNLAPLHLDAHYSAESIYGQRLVNSLYTAGLIGGMIVYDLTMGTTLGNLGYTKFDFPNPVFHGDTLRAETTILDKRESVRLHGCLNSWPDSNSSNHMPGIAGLLSLQGQIGSINIGSLGHSLT